MIMELLQLEYFCRAVREGSFSAVARHSMVPPSSVSHTISRLERELGCELFSRTGNRIALNDYGHAFYENVSGALESIETAKSTLCGMKEQTVSVMVLQGGYSVVPMLSAFREKHPEIGLRFPLKSLEHRGNFVIRISAEPFDDKGGAEFVHLFDERILVAIPEGDPLSAKSTLCFDDIRDKPVIWFGEAPESAEILDYYRARGARPNIMLECRKESFAAELVKNGFGIAFYPESAHPIGKSEGVRTRVLSDLDVLRSIYASWPKRFSPNSAAETFIDFAVDYFATIK